MFKWMSSRLHYTVAMMLGLALAGCGGSYDYDSGHVSAYQAGYGDGFAVDSEYFAGYTDSWITEGAAPIFYRGHEIPFLNDDSYDAGYFDGLFDAYNDGYFVAYRYAFIIGFSDGYDAAYAPDYLDFLLLDQHFEFLHGGFSDGYNDGFSEGRVFGAFDYEAVFPFDWLDAFLDWEFGTDLFFEEVNVGTGTFGPVILYEWATNPFNLFARDSREDSSGKFVSMRMSGSTKNVTNGARDLERPLTQELQNALNVAPATSDRTSRPLSLQSTWLDRINAYNAAGVSKEAGVAADSSLRATSPRAR